MASASSCSASTSEVSIDIPMYSVASSSCSASTSYTPSDAINEIQMAPASSSCSASTSNTPYDVFINHRGPDVKNTFAGHLFHALKSRGLQVFLDRPELQAGHDISCQIGAAIEVASVHIAIFSERYAESKWCMEELVLMLNSRGTILPVFYKVKPSELRRGKYAEALQKHEENQRYELQTIQEWKNALSHVADISGFELEACNGDEVELVDKIVKRVLELVPKSELHVAKYKIGLQEKLEDFQRAVLSQQEEEQGPVVAKVVGIVGSGGIGKSTLARQFFNNKRSTYSGSSFLVNVRENAAMKSINSLQKKLIRDLTGRDISIDSWEEGIGILQKNLKSCHALIVLDDADHRDQLDAFLPIKHVVDPNSLILVISRDRQVLINAEIANTSIYQLKGLDRAQSLELFCWHAFFLSQPQPGFESLVDRFLKVCDGFPLSLEVFGALVCQNDKSYWEERLNGIKKLPNDIKVRLKISYDSLEPEEQQMFLDIAWLAIGDNKERWIRTWSWLGRKGSVCFRNLEIRMHDHLVDMGKEIALGGSMLLRQLMILATYLVVCVLENSLSVVTEGPPIIIEAVRRNDWPSWVRVLRFAVKLLSVLFLIPLPALVIWDIIDDLRETEIVKGGLTILLQCLLSILFICIILFYVRLKALRSRLRLVVGWGIYSIFLCAVVSGLFSRIFYILIYDMLWGLDY